MSSARVISPGDPSESSVRVVRPSLRGERRRQSRFSGGGGASGRASVYLYLSPRASGVAFTYWSCIPGAKAGVKLEAEHAVVRVVAQVVFSKFEQRLHLGPVIAPVRRSYSERSCQTWLLH